MMRILTAAIFFLCLVSGVHGAVIGVDDPGVLDPKMEDSKWDAAINKRILDVRTGKVIVHVTRDGKPVSGAAVEIKQLKHDFQWGNILPTPFFLDPVPGKTPTAQETKRYLDIFRELFNTASTENGLKWWWQERERGHQQFEPVDRIAAWCKQNDIYLRGHAVIYHGAQPEWVMQLSQEERQKVSEARVRQVVSRYRGLINEYDVINETSFPWGQTKEFSPEFIASMYQVAHQVDPSALLCANEGINANAPNGLTEKYPYYDWLLGTHVPVHVIGLEEHYYGPLPTHGDIEKYLNHYASYGLPIRVTEFDYDGPDAPQLAAFKLFLPHWFSHPSITGITQWGIWEKAHWKPTAALYRADFSARPVVDYYKRMVFKEWWTNATGKADAAGVYSTNAFYGQHKVTITDGSAKVEKTIQFSKGMTPFEVTIDLGPAKAAP